MISTGAKKVGHDHSAGPGPMAGVALLSLLLGPSIGCAVGPDYRRPPVTTPTEIRGQAAGGETASLADDAWWELFQDETLKALIAEALKNGYDVRLAAWRVEEARAIAGIAKSEYFPQVQLEGEWRRGQVPGTISPNPGTFDLVDVRLGLTWELDLWGRIRRLNEAALAQYLATEEARRGVMLSLASEVAASYFQLRELDLELEIARRTETAFRETYDLFSLRLEGGVGSSLETASAEASLAATSGNIPDLERQIVAQENRLALLLGRSPGPIPRGAALNDQLLPPEIPVGLPSDLLQRRPDIREAEQNLIAANANVGVAVANFFPAIRLTGAFGGVATEVSELFGDGRLWSVGGGLLTPVFQGRQLKNQHRAALAQWEQAKVRYERSVTNAFHEVSTFLTAHQKLARVEQELARAVEADRLAVSLANERYVAGLSSYLEVLEAQQQLFPAENALAQTRFNRLDSVVQLYKALGGGWNLSDPQWSGPALQNASMSAPNP